MNIRQLQHFLQVMETGSLSLAAEKVYLSESALSRSLRALEDELRVPLFDRSNRRLQPTAYAFEYLERAKRIVFDEREGARALTMMKLGDYGSLKIGLGSSLAMDFLSPMIKTMLKESPNIRIQALVQSSDILLEELLKEKLDFFIGDVKLVAGIGEISVEPLYNCDVAWFARKDHPLACKKNITIKDIQKYPMIGSGYMNDSHAWTMSRLYDLSLPIENHFSASINNLETVHKLIVATDAIAPSTFIAMLHLLRSGEVVKIDVCPELKLDMVLGVIRLSLRTLVPSVEKVFDLLREYFIKVDTEIKEFSSS
ncbi:hypothetical protein B9T31_13315 [Acinetobacter sp. ANC 4558]|uniref:LysR family transcriptional regulator n=1 Tax=Acinetobacter sp. ANC 4558 TaxID=1977876 RepID=UPI000A34A3C5|nr:LysR family transcriptional regulator [Acinetobacter sp. ANC 4558]OTG84132.1 hypothetical protein B9T31_13315 [Acinetobacter sp. ANC 4558]